MKLSDIIKILEDFAPLVYQEDYDNSGLQIGEPGTDIKGILCTVDITKEVLDEAINKDANLIVAHHPLIFSGLRSLTGRSEVELLVKNTIKSDIAIYACHTNLDNISYGVNQKICEKLGITEAEPIIAAKGELLKLVTFVPLKNAEEVRMALFSAGAGHIGNYDSCSYNIEGTGSFRGDDSTNPHVGEKGKLHYEPEIRIETILPKASKSKVLSALFNIHPYEEVAYDLYPLENKYNKIGAGKIGNLKSEMHTDEFLNLLKKTFKSSCIRYSGGNNIPIKKVAVCGGSGSFLIKHALMKGANAFVTGDIKYHQFFENENKMLLADIGHFESEQFTKEIFYEILSKKIPNFAVHLSEIKTNPIKYFH